MCGRFYIDPDDMSDEKLIALLNREKESAEKRISIGEVRPGDCAAVIAMNRRQQHTAFVMQWGYHCKNRLIINARSETAAEKDIFRNGMQMRRCLIPASAYYEWDHRQKPYQKYVFSSANRQMIYLAGIYRFESSDSLPVFSILTREAAPDIACFHDRMPVIVPDEKKEIWLDRSQAPEQILSCAITQTQWKKAI